MADALAVTQEEFETTFGDLFRQLAVARVNDGRLDVISSPQLMTKKNEVVHLEIAAGLMKEVTVREWQAGSTGFSFPIGKGVRFRTGSTRGRSVVVGTELQVEDTGILSVTSQRVAYMGQRKTVDIPYTKLMGLELFTDAIRLSASNRQRAPLVKLPDGFSEVVGATINAAVARTSE